MKVLLLASHCVSEHDDVQMFARMGYDVFAPGGYADPLHPAEAMRPPIPEAPVHPELEALCHAQRVKHEGEDASWAIDWAKADLHPDLLDWADVVIVHHFPERWIAGQWGNIRHKRVIWRTCGQSNPDLERYMSALRAEGLQVVRYSPAEERAFRPLGMWAGADAVIRFGKDPAEWTGWTGTDAVIGNVTQRMTERGDHCGLAWYEQVTAGLPARPAGEYSERLPGGIGALAYDDMRAYLRAIRVYLYTGTQPASYTLGLIEAMMTGVPVVSIGPAQMWLPKLFEGHELAVEWADHPEHARAIIAEYLREPDHEASGYVRERAIDLFGLETISEQWKDFLQ